MQEFLDYLKGSKEAVEEKFSRFENVHFVLGNESCDLDSTVSSILLAFFLYNQKFFNNKSYVVTPILNVPFENFVLRTEVVFALKEAGIDLKLLTFRDQMDFKNLIGSKNVTVSLVDHHILSKSDEILEAHVTEIFDHRPVDPLNRWDKNKVKILIAPVASCCTLIGNEICKVDINMLPKKLAYLLYETIIYDSIALLPQNGKAKELDIKIGENLERHFNFTEDRKAVFDKIWSAHIDISHLTPGQLLFKDLKVVNGTYVPGLPMLVQDFLKMDSSLCAINTFTAKNNISHLVLVGLEAKNSVVKRDVGLFWKDSSGKKIIDTLYCELKNSETLKGYNFEFNEIVVDIKNIILLEQNNTKLSRKQLIPIIQHATAKCSNK